MCPSIAQAGDLNMGAPAVAATPIPPAAPEGSVSRNRSGRRKRGTFMGLVMVHMAVVLVLALVSVLVVALVPVAGVRIVHHRHHLRAARL